MLQFGVRKPATDYRHRAVAFGVVEREGLIACVRVERATGPYFDLPGGGLDVEETGLTITPLNRIAEASQYFIRSTDEPLNNVGGFWTARVVSEDPTAKCEDDHTLVWLDPTFALSRLRHDSHAWAVAVWLRRAS